MTMTIPPLDDPSLYRRLDPGGMLDRIHQLPLQCREAWESALCLPLPDTYKQARDVVVLGLGGSAIGGDLAASLVAGECQVPVQVVREYDAPAFVGAETLVIASSYSGETEETLSAFRQARDAGARLLAISTGGTLAALAAELGAPVWPIDYVAQPRAAIGFSFLSVLAILQRLSFIGDWSGRVAEMLQALDVVGGQVNEQVPAATNPAKQLAATLHGRLPVIYGGGVLATVARRWKGQIDENAKGWAFFEAFPELNHNAVVGYQFPPAASELAFVVLLQGTAMHPRVRLRYGVTAELLARHGVAHQTVDAQGDSPLSQVMSLVLFGDYVSYYLALLNGVDPTPVEAISFLKARLAAE